MIQKITSVGYEMDASNLTSGVYFFNVVKKQKHVVYLYVLNFVC